MPVAAATRHVRARTRRAMVREVLALTVAFLALVLAPDAAQAALTVHGSQQTPGELSVSWRSDVAGTSALCWYDDYPSGAPMLAAPNCVHNTSSAIGTEHSASLQNLPIGTYWYVAASQPHAAGVLAYSAPVEFEITAAGGRGDMTNLVTDGGKITATTTNAARTRSWIAGDFEHVGQRSPSGVVVGGADADTVVSGLPSITNAAGPATVNVTTEDGEGGWYIAGDFTAIGGVAIEDVAHILPDGGLDFGFPAPDPSFDPSTAVGLASSGQSGVVYAMAYDPYTEDVYVGGDFANWNGVAIKDNLVRLNRSGSRDTAFAMYLDILKPVRAIEPDPRTTLDSRGDIFVGGDFAQGFGPGATPPWFSHVVTFEDSGQVGCGALGVCFGLDSISIGGDQTLATVRSLEYVPSVAPRLAIGGRFDRVSHTKVNNDPDDDSPVVQNGFTIVSADAGTRNVADNFIEYPPFGGNVGVGTGTVNDVQLTGSAELAIGGDFANGFGTGYPDLASVDVNMGTGSVVPTPGFMSRFEATSGAVGTLAFASGQLLVGGAFSTNYGTVAPNKRQIDDAVAVSATTGALSTANPTGRGVDGPVHSIAISGSHAYVGGAFEIFDGATSDGIAALDLIAGRVKPDPTFVLTRGTGPNNTVNSMSALGANLAVGGEFTSLAGVARNRVGIVNAATGAHVVLNAHVDGTVNSVMLNGSNLWIGGSFTTLRSAFSGGQQTGCTLAATCENLAVVDASTGVATPLHSSGPNGTVWALAASGSSVYVGGSFTAVGLTTGMNGLAKFDSTTTAHTGTPATATPLVRALLVHGGYLYVAGPNTLGGTAAHRLGRIDLTSGSVENFGTSSHVGIASTLPAADNDIVALAPGPTAQRVYVGGAFANYGAQPLLRSQPALAMINTETGRVVSTVNPRPATASSVAAPILGLASLGTGANQHLIVGGPFDTYDARSGRGGLGVASSPTDVRAPSVSVTAVTPLSDAVVAGDGTIVLKNATGSGITVATTAHDRFAAGTAGNGAVSGLASVSSAAIPNSSWRIDNTTATPTFATARGLARRCWVNGVQVTGISSRADNLDLAGDDGDLVDQLTSQPAATPERCTWSGVIAAPGEAITRSARITAMGSGLTIALITGTATVNIASGGSATVGLSHAETTRIEAEWIGGPADVPNVGLAWRFAGGTSSTIPSGAFTASAPANHVYSLANGGQSDTPSSPHVLSFGAVDGEGNAAPTATVRVALDKTAPSGDSLTSNIAPSTTASTSDASVTLKLTTGSDGAGYVAGVASRIISVDYKPTTYGALGLFPSCSGGTPVQQSWPAGDVSDDIGDGVTSPQTVATYTFGAAGCYRFRYDVEDELGNAATTAYANGAGASDWIRTTGSGGLLADVLTGTGETVGGVLGGVGQTVASLGATGQGAKRIRVELRRPNGTVAATPCDSDVATYTVTPGPGFPEPGTAFMVIDNGDGTYKIRCKYDTSSAAGGLNLPDGPYDVYNIITDNADVEQESDPVAIHADDNAPTVRSAITASIDDHAYAPNGSTVWIRPDAASAFTIDIAADDDRAADATPFGQGTLAQSATFETSAADWTTPLPANAVVTPGTDDTTDPRIKHFARTYTWNPLTGTVPGSDSLTLDNSVVDLIPAHVSEADVTVNFDDDVPVASVAYDNGEVTDATGHPFVTITLSDGSGSGIGSVDLTRYEAATIPATSTQPPSCPALSDVTAWTTSPPVVTHPSSSFTDLSTTSGRCYRYTLDARDRVGLYALTSDPGFVARTEEVGVTITQDDPDPRATVDEDLPNAADVIHVEIGSTPSPGPAQITIADPFAGTDQQQVELQIGSGPRSGSQSLSFSAKHAPQDLRIYPVNDLWDEADTHDVTLQISSTDPAYAAMATTTYQVRITDNDTSATLAQPSTPLVVQENGVGAQTLIGLVTKPFGTVTALVDLGPDLVGTVDPNVAPARQFTTTFTKNAMSRTLYVTAVNDELVRSLPQQSVRITVDPTATTDAKYASASFAPVPVTVRDDDAAVLTLTGDKSVLADGVLSATEGGDATELVVTATKASVGDVTITPVVKSGAGLTVGSAQTIGPSTPNLQARFSVRVADDDRDSGEAYDGEIEWRVTATDAAFTAKVPATKVRIVDNDEPEARKPRETAPAKTETPAETTPSPSTPNPPRGGTRVPQSQTATPTPAAPQIPTPILPIAQPSAGADPGRQNKPKGRPVKAEQASGVTGWAKEHKVAAAATGASVLAAAGGAAAAKTGLMGALKGLLGAGDNILDRLDPRNLKHRHRLRDLANKRLRRRDLDERDRRWGRRKRRKRGEEDILDELTHKYDPDYEDPLEQFERGPATNRSDVLRDVETRLRGFDLDDAA